MIDLWNNQFTASLWGDEAFSAVLANRSLVDIVSIVSRDTSPPGYYFSSHLWMQLFGNSEIAIRGLSFAFHLGTVLSIFFLAKYLWGKKTAIIAALLIFFNPFLFAYAFEGRMYTILAFTTTLSFYFFIRRQWVLYVLAATAALYSHHFSIFAIMLQGLLILWEIIKKPKKKLKLLLPYLFIFILYIPWLYPLYYQTSLVEGGFWLGRPDLNSVINLFRDFIGLRLTGQLKNIVSILAVAILFLRRWDFKKKKKDIIFLLWFFVPIVITFVVSQLMSSIFYDRYLLYVIPGLMILLSSKRRRITLFLLAIILVIWIINDFDYFFKPTKKPFRQFSSFVEENIGEDEFLINYNGKAHHLWETKYYGLQAPLYSSGGPLPFFVGTAQMKEEDVIYTLEGKDKIAVITSENPEDVEIEDYKTTSFKTIGELSLLWMEKRR